MLGLCSLLNGDSMGKKLDLVGQRFGRLVVDEKAGVIKTRVYWFATCDCGTETMATSGHLRSGNVLSCGCLRLDNSSKANTTHGMTDTPTLEAWHYIHYHVGHCSEWEDFKVFLADVGEKPSPKHRLARHDRRKEHSPTNDFKTR